MKDILTTAVEFANRDEHSGAGYTLFVKTIDGKESEYAVTATKKPGELVLTPFDREHGGSTGDIVFFNVEHIISVQVEW